MCCLAWMFVSTGVRLWLHGCVADVACSVVSTAPYVLGTSLGPDATVGVSLSHCLRTPHDTLQGRVSLDALFIGVAACDAESTLWVQVWVYQGVCSSMLPGARSLIQHYVQNTSGFHHMLSSASCCCIFGQVAPH